MIRKKLVLFVCTAVLILTAGCGIIEKADVTGPAVEPAPEISGATDISEITESSETAEISDDPDISDARETREIRENADIPETSGIPDSDYVDLTVLSSTMVYSEVFNMMMEPEKYIGKTVKMSGMYSVYYDESKDKYYHACIISDATACCSQGLEFELTEDYKYPDDYPEEAEDVCVTGIFDTYQEDGYKYCVLKNARIG